MISVIIPALDESRAIGGTLDALLGQAGDFEVIVVDGGSTDGTADIARARPRVRVTGAARGRAAQMNAGAALAAGKLLLFLHADTRLPADGIARLNALEADPQFAWGGFRHRFSGRGWPLRAVSRLHNLRCRLTGVFYGDQAMVVRRSLFMAAGGFPAAPVLEDILLSERLRKLRRPVMIRAEVTTDSRKFEQAGPWRSLWRCLVILARHRLRLPVAGRAFFEPVR